MSNSDNRRQEFVEMIKLLTDEEFSEVIRRINMEINAGHLPLLQLIDK